MTKDKITNKMCLTMIFHLLSTSEPLPVIFRCRFREAIDYVPSCIPFLQQEFAISGMDEEV